jgi:hypothetical protein
VLFSFCSTFCCFFLMDAAAETLRWFLEQCLGSVVALRRNRQHGVEGIHWWILDLRLAGGRKKVGDTRVSAPRMSGGGR